MRILLKQGATLVSACLMGLCTRYDGKSRPSEHIMRIAGYRPLVPVCPEQLGGLSTPRPPAEIAGGKTGFDVINGTTRVITLDDNMDVTDAFLLGAAQCLTIAETLRVETCMLKSGSPSCGVSMRTGRTGRTGVTAAMLMLAGFQVIEVDS